MANVLFLCIGNAGRSQMAHAFLERHGGHEVRSAGSRAETQLHPEVVAAMAEIGYDLSGRVPRQLEPAADAAWADVVVKLGVGPHTPEMKKLTAEKLAQAIDAAVNDSALRARAAALGEKIRAENGVARAVEIIERHAAEFRQRSLVTN